MIRSVSAMTTRRISSGLWLALILGGACRGPQVRTGSGAGVPLCDAGCVVYTFKRLAAIYRPSGEEQEIRAELIRLASEANQRRWKGKLEIAGPDGVGNFVVRVPATGAFAGRALPPVALQAHMDMVLAAAAVGPGGDLRAHFRRHPIAIEEREGRLHSVGQQTSIGADNTVGCALMLRYALDPGIQHPALELVFTVSEEAGLRGAKEYDTAALPLRAPVMVSLDGFDTGTVAYGSQGSRRQTVTGTLPAAPVAAGKLITVTVSGLRGGHSGADIHRRRLNAVVALARVAAPLLADRRLRVVAAVAGDSRGLNKIPTDLQLTLAAPAAVDGAALRATVETALREAVAAYPGEAGNPDVEVAVAESPAPREPVSALLPEAAARLFATVATAESQNGVVTRQSGYPNQVNTSANVALLELKPQPGAPTRRAAIFGFMVRSFSAAELADTVRRLDAHFAALFTGGATSEPLSGYDPWLEGPDSWVVALASTLELDGRRRFRTAGVQAIGVEPSYFSKKFPGLAIVGMGATITDAHTVHEAVSVQSIFEITATLDLFLARVADAGAFRARPAPPAPG
jgi:dipeptidase D